MMLILRTISPRSRKVIRYCTWGALIVLVLAISPFLVDVLIRGIDWIIGLFPHSRSLWEETSWLR
jgi:hypothetical protein